MKKYYIYETKNIINDKIYIGQHASEDIVNDTYIGSGDIIKKAINKYGRSKFKRTVLFEFDTLEEAYLKEKELVTEEFLDRDDTYNVRLGGVGMFGHTRKTKDLLAKKMTEFWESDRSDDLREHLSSRQKELWSDPDYKANMVAKFNTVERNEKLSKNLKQWIIDNPEAHTERMDKINKNPEKIRKMAEKQTGRPKSDSCKANISKAQMGKYVGEKNGNFKGWYHTPYGKFESLKQASDAIGNSVICVRDRCVVKNGNVVTITSVNTDTKITKDMLGKTWKELGWYFEEKV